MSAQLLRWKPPVSLRELRAVPDALVFQLGQESGHSSIRDGPRQAAVVEHPCHVQRFHHHAAGALGYRGRGLVVIVIPDLDDPGVDLPAFGVEALTPVAATGLPCAVLDLAMALSTWRNRLSAPFSALGFSTFRPLEHTASVPSQRQRRWWDRLSPAGPAVRPRGRSWRTTCRQSG